MFRRMGARCVALTVTGAAVLMAASSASAATIRPPDHINPMVPFSRVNHDTVTSSNWSGYAVQSPSQFTDAQGSWTEPSVSCPSNSAQYASFWVGIDGYSSDSVEQLGTDSDCNGRNRPSYYAWYEMYPADSVELSTSKYPVKAGDTLSASVSVSGTTFTLSIASSEGWTYTTKQSGAGLAQSSAEWIAESPEICSRRCTLAQLSDFGTVNFSKSEATAGGTVQPISSFTYDSGPHDIIATTNSGTVRAQPSALGAGGSSFSIAWNHD
ncbi:MAG: G1 family glutamic endopeptidase [Solirubrobacteraceae bacterium]